jgi:lysyl endopeptidase
MTFGAFKKLIVLAAVAVGSVAASASATPNAPYYNEFGVFQTGAIELLNITANAAVNNAHIITYPDASYIAVRFENFDLPEGDVLIVRSPDSTDGFVYTGKGRGDLGTFTSSSVRGTTALVEYFAMNSTVQASKVSYKIGGYVRGFSSSLSVAPPVRRSLQDSSWVDRSLCGAVDETQPAKCFVRSATVPQAYAKARAVARLKIAGLGLCTGWLVGSAGHLITNRHCIRNAADAAHVEVEFNAESASCTDACATSRGCLGTIVARSAAFITNNQAIDYALLKLPASLASTYGYLQFRAAGPKAGEKIYIPQHPAGWAKRIVSISDGAAATVSFVNRDRTGCGDKQVGYKADTQGGSSGAPVIAQSDNLVIALHHCGGCDNLAVDPRTILNDLKSKGISVPNASR